MLRKQLDAVVGVLEQWHVAKDRDAVLQIRHAYIGCENYAPWDPHMRTRGMRGINVPITVPAEWPHSPVGWQ